MTDLYRQMKEQSGRPTRSVSNAANLTSLCVDISPSSSNFFEVLYIGKIKVSTKKVADTFIDEALEKFKAHELEKTKRKPESDLKTAQSSYTLKDEQEKPPPVKSSSLQNLSEEKRDIDDHNRTMVLQVDRTDLRLISPDRKSVIMHRQHRDVTCCLQGIANGEHFGFVCREGQNAVLTGYVFKCESASVAGDAVQAISQAFSNADKPFRNTITSCEHCPMVWFHKLCAEIEHLSDRKTQAAIFRKIDQLDEDEQNVILTKFRGAETDSVTEQNEFLMMLLRAHCEMKQGRHVHDTAENRSEFLNQYLGGGTIFTKAKRSLTSSFDHLLKRRASRDDIGAAASRELSLVMNREASPTLDTESECSRSRTSTIGSQNDLNNPSPDRTLSDKNLKSPMMDM